MKKVFVAYRMGVPSSETMNDTLRRLLKRDDIDAIDGNVLGGQYWAPEIRRRIRSAGLIVADVTGPSREVVFELGAVGAKAEFPIVETEEDLAKIPAWLMAYHIPSYTGPGIVRIAQRAVELVKARRPNTIVRPIVDPTMMVWVESREHEWVAEEKARLRERCRQLDVDFVEVSLKTHRAAEDVRALMAAWIVVCVMSGDAEDTLGHYLVGDVVARPTTVGNRGPRRFAVALTQGHFNAVQYIASSVRNLPATYGATSTPESLNEILAPKFDALRRYRADRRTSI